MLKPETSLLELLEPPVAYNLEQQRCGLWHCHSNWRDVQCSCQAQWAGLETSKAVTCHRNASARLKAAPSPKTVCIIASGTARRPFAPFPPLTILALSTTGCFSLASTCERSLLHMHSFRSLFKFHQVVRTLINSNPKTTRGYFHLVLWFAVLPAHWRNCYAPCPAALANIGVYTPPHRRPQVHISS